MEGYRWGSKGWPVLAGWSWLRLCGIRVSEDVQGEGVYPWRCRSLLDERALRRIGVLGPAIAMAWAEVAGGLDDDREDDASPFRIS